MKKAKRAKGLTLIDVVNHIGASKQHLSSQMKDIHKELSGRMDTIEKRMDGMDNRMDRMERRIEWIDVHVMNIEGRLDTIEVEIIKRKHEPRLRKIERHLGFARA